MADVAVAALSVFNARKKKETVEGFDDGSGFVVAFLLIYLLIVVGIWGIAFYMASFCADAAINYIIAFLFPVIYIIVRLIAPCGKGGA